MMKKEQDNRRSFLKHMLAGTAAVVGTAAIVKSAKAKSTPAGQRPDEVLYQETESFSKYYKTLRS
ncbi:MAG: twin-arginine translocation signal domain-containing protein [Deltaproteobacteria bacterium]|nr:twin-arginine translocation signal domain-containing protein [Deltaproteobacteria bacterium]